MTIITALLAAGLQAAAPGVQDDGGRFYLGLGLGASVFVADETSGIPIRVFVGEDEFGFPIVENRTTSIDSDAGLGGASQLFVGYRINPKLSVEIESAAWLGDSDAWVGEYVGTNLLSVNAVLWGDQTARLIPYAGVGVGYSRFLDDDGVIDFFDGRVAGKAKVGFVAPVARSHGLGVEANLVAGPRFEGSGTIEQEASAIGLTATYRYQFGGFAGR